MAVNTGDAQFTAFATTFTQAQTSAERMDGMNAFLASTITLGADVPSAAVTDTMRSIG
ncbi:hypothetical protein GCM10007886_00860 [Methylobacterium gregans]|uniref:Uncharacterized protein n=2 Tax=Methylobacterium gregans TaxID=374424 RepID=A0AA37HMY2_9HYPH|nr:hypothetical protein [Methylobacterium gregans]MDQ0522059.1 hypothetical protein [Methylobacterium gregans]GJD78653.1 hypothetical protein NBEOAGPD_1871 [Methylobacterium gregans]GLS51904.1 hypothetical protein GCM10007886_00860 [Methylobacterium gregans]